MPCSLGKNEAAHLAAASSHHAEPPGLPVHDNSLHRPVVHCISSPRSKAQHKPAGKRRAHPHWCRGGDGGSPGGFSRSAAAAGESSGDAAVHHLGRTGAGTASAKCPERGAVAGRGVGYKAGGRATTEPGGGRDGDRCGTTAVRSNGKRNRRGRDLRGRAVRPPRVAAQRQNAQVMGKARWWERGPLLPPVQQGHKSAQARRVHHRFRASSKERGTAKKRIVWSGVCPSENQ